ncbi:MAG: hypothetical protein NZZ41_01730 [Candidatus Dojkabacteria bacterium]|nr:hypothetical protein [Candidatus Dojkabacteria bacterium]
MDLLSLKEEYKKLMKEEKGKIGVFSHDTHSKPVKTVERNPGTVDAPKDYQSKENSFKLAKTVDREPGPPKSSQFRNSYHTGKRSDKASKLDTDTTIDREEGSEAGAQAVGEYGTFKEFKNKIRQKLGLPLDSKLNKGY